MIGSGSRSRSRLLGAALVSPLVAAFVGCTALFGFDPHGPPGSADAAAGLDGPPAGDDGGGGGDDAGGGRPDGGAEAGLAGTVDPAFHNGVVTVNGFAGGEVVGIAARSDDELLGLALLRTAGNVSQAFGALHLARDGSLLGADTSVSGVPYAMAFMNGLMYALGYQNGAVRLVIYDNTAKPVGNTTPSGISGQALGVGSTWLWIAGTYTDAQGNVGLAVAPFDAQGNPAIGVAPYHLTPTAQDTTFTAFGIAPDDTMLVAGFTGKAPIVLQVHRIAHDGTVTTISDAFTGIANVTGFAPTSGGAFVAVGSSAAGATRFARVLADGGADPAFAAAGDVLAPLGVVGSRVVVGASAQPLAGVWPSGADAGPTIGVAELTAGGALDTSFGNGGAVLYTAPAGYRVPFVHAMCEQSDGAVVVAGTDFAGGSSANPLIARFR